MKGVKMLYDLRKRFHSHLRDPFLWNAMVDDHVDEIFRIRRGSRERVGDFLLSLLTSVSLDPEEKRRIIFMSATMERWRIQQLLTIFEAERIQFDDLIRQSTIAVSHGCIHHLRCHRFPMEAGPATERLGTILTRFIRLAPDHHPELHARLRRLSDPAVEDRIPAILDFIALCHQELVDELSGEKVSLGRGSSPWVAISPDPAGIYRTSRRWCDGCCATWSASWRRRSVTSRDVVGATESRCRVWCSVGFFRADQDLPEMRCGSCYPGSMFQEQQESRP
jgi:hypothetical protein